MVMVADSVPGLKRWIGTLGLKDSAKLLVIRVIVAFLFMLHGVALGPASVLIPRVKQRSRRQDAEFAIHLHGVGIDYGAVEAGGEGQRQGGFAAGSGPGDDQGRRGHVRAPVAMCRLAVRRCAQDVRR